MAKEFDVIVVGAGMVGALTTSLLAHRHLRVALLDKGIADPVLSQPPAFDARVSAVSPHSQNLLAKAGAWARMDTTRLTPYYQMRVWDGLGTGHIEFSSDDIHADYLGHLVENQVINKALLDEIHHYSCVTPCFATHIEEIQTNSDGVKVVTSDGAHFQAPLLVAADGAQSFVRTSLGFETREWEYSHTAIVATVEIDRPHEHTAWQSFGEEGILAFLPMPNTSGHHLVSIVWSVSPKDAEALCTLSEEAFCQRLGFAISNQFSALKLHSQRVAIPLRQRHARQYVQPRIALVGDAAHTIHPLAGQGVNLGFADGEALANVVLHAFDRGDDIGDMRVLRRYQRQRMADNLRMSAAMEFFKQLYTRQNPALVLARNLGMNWVNQQQLLKNHVISLATGRPA